MIFSLQSAAAYSLSQDAAKQQEVSAGITLYDQNVYITKTASELLFEGYEDDFIGMAREYVEKYGEGGVEIPYERFGWFFGVSLNI